MTALELTNQRISELIESGENVLKTRRSPPPNVMGDDYVDDAMSQQWATSAADMLRRTFGAESEYYKRFAGAFKYAGYYTDMARGLAIIKAANADLSQGYLLETAALIRADICSDLLEQAEYLLEQGFFQPAAVLAGAILEDSLRTLCQRKGIAIPTKPKLDAMNSELARKGVYNTLVQKRITWLADIRNSAAHGNWSEFSKADVERMLPQVRDFVTDYATH